MTFWLGSLLEWGGVGGAGAKKKTPPFWGSKIMNLLVFTGRDPIGFVWAEWDDRSCNFQPFLYILHINPWGAMMLMDLMDHRWRSAYVACIAKK